MEHHAFTWLSAFEADEPIVTAVFVAILLVGFALVVKSRVGNVERALEPEDGLTVRNVAEAFVEGMNGLAEGVLGHHYQTYVPLLATFFAFILLSNLLGLIPGFSPPTSSFQMTFGLGLVSFFAYHAYGLRAQGLSYLKHFLGPLALLAPLMLPIELVSHMFRPISLGIRLYANMFADHAVIAIFTDLTQWVIPVVFYGLGALVCVTQAFVFTMLTAIYISLGVSHDH
jgi:F-type H+-transporting ATPase subunit a